MRLPLITHLHALVLRLIRGGARNSVEIREGLAAHGVDTGDPAFYMLLQRMQTQGWVREENVKRPGGRDKPRRRYDITPDGRAALKEAQEFYENENCRRAA